ncbi:uncharacterized protein [Ptychodera flava]|uniref:uncharacterized protein n=1 Tax=Ptychodera flava TaxID=63121 RepID=UPI00396A0F39
MTSLFLAERWSRVGDTVSAINCQLASLAAQNRQTKICCVVLKATEEEKKDAADCGVELIQPCFNKHVLDIFKDDKPTSDWILSPETFFTTLLELQNVEYIVEHIQSSTISLISVVLKDRFFKHADIVLINHGIPPADLRQKYLKFAEAAEAVFSVGPTVFKEYNLIYRGNEIHINHLLYLPRPEKDFFDLNVDQQLSKSDSVKQILSIITDKDVKCDKYKFLSAVIGQTAVALESVIGDIPKWFVRISSQADPTDTKNFLKDNLECSFIEPNAHSLNSSQQHAITDLQQSNVLVIPPDEPFSMEALQAIAAGLPVLVPKRTATAEFLGKYFKADAEHFLYDPLVDGGLSKQINKMLLKSEQASHAILVLKSKLQSNSEVTATHENFKSCFMKHLRLLHYKGKSHRFPGWDSKSGRKKATIFQGCCKS